jgi:Mg-chelatase subunit ChlD
MKYTCLLLISFFYISLSIDISIFNGDKLFNKNTPIILNLFSKDTSQQTSNVDLICVIDVSGSMSGEKILLVKESLKKLISLMTEKDRISIVLFNHQAFKILDLTYTTSENKMDIKNKINNIKAGGGTIIISGLTTAIDILKLDQLKNKDNKDYKNRIPSIILLSDGNDNNMDDIQLSQSFKEITKNLNLFFTVHTFGYGSDHDPKIMTKLANIRDGSFYYVSEFNKVQSYFINVLGGCMSVISNYVKVNVNSIFPLKKVFGEEELYSYNFNINHFDTEILQFISGKEYTYVFEVDLPENINDGDKIFDVEVVYIDKNGKEIKENKDFYYQGKLEILILEKANEEYVRSMTFETMKNAFNLREKNKIDEARKTLNDMKTFYVNDLEKKNIKKLNDYISKFDSSLNLMTNDELFNYDGEAIMMGNIREGQRKVGGSDLFYSNQLQKNLIAKVTG